MDYPVRFKARIASTKDWWFADWEPGVGAVVDATYYNSESTKVFYITHLGQEQYKILYNWRLELVEEGGTAWTTP